MVIVKESWKCRILKSAGKIHSVTGHPGFARRNQSKNAVSPFLALPMQLHKMTVILDTRVLLMRGQEL